MSDSDTSSLSSAQSIEDEAVEKSINKSIGLEKYFKPKPPPEPSSPPPLKREPSPPHEYVLADNPDIPFIVMFRSRFSDVFPKSLPNYGPQDIERGVTDNPPSDHIERLLCALIGLVLNRKKDVERGHYQRALEEVIQTHSSQWPKAWNGKNPLHGGGTFAAMSPTERVTLLKTLVLWALCSSDAIQATLKESYKQARHEDDLNQPLSVQPWGRDAYKRRYWLIEGQGDTHFRLYRESNPTLKNISWWSVAGAIPELNAVADSLAEEKSQHSKRLSEKIHASIPRFEGSEEKRKRRDYRLARKAAFARPEPGFSLYEGRTRGKKLKYTFSDDEDDFSSDAPLSRRSTRISTPAEPTGPTFTASGRQVRARVGGTYGETMLSTRRNGVQSAVSADDEGDGQLSVANGRSRRARANGWAHNTGDVMDEESDAASSDNGSEVREDDANYADDDEEMSDSESSANVDGEQPSLVVQLRYGKKDKQADNDTQKANPPPPTPPADLGAAKQTSLAGFFGQKPTPVQSENQSPPRPAPAAPNGEVQDKCEKLFSVEINNSTPQATTQQPST
ncbi:hypothetical protein AJ80_02526 [Polytolypa hystricis UAMH7299]|uniref:WHIM1 domain-containing protein n=1 Tax=Polytolypa hystricis (strain UAMH7299) TaxID=1447883 RepID=A0A2B7YP47_POLH7|nr:hypothetical protein AJ80_02526 [Polytolypa hystricis UAMH7299]